ncbi:MAG: VOC family protein [Alphaproteobacteria bacterium]|nr:VOC family protein [Alphaproteobacteria bacterium]
MGHKIFVNLPVSDLERSMKFWKKVGFTFNPQFTDATAACLVFSDDIYAMLLTQAKFSEFTTKTIADTATTAEALIALSTDSREEVDRITEAAIAAGGLEPYPAKDHGFMLQRAFTDPDGHNWEVFHMDPSFVQPQT